MNGVCAEPNSYVVKLSDGRLFRRTRWAINISSVDCNLNPVRPCIPRPKIRNGVTGTEVVEQADALPMAGKGTVTNPLLELYNHTNHQVAAHTIWETSWPAYITEERALLPPLVHLAAGTTLYGSQLLEKEILFFI